MNWSISYLELPILLKYKISKGKNIETALHIGPYVAQKLDATKNTEFEGIREEDQAHECERKRLWLDGWLFI